MKTPGLLWLYLVIAFGCLVLLSVVIRVNFEFVNAVESSCTCHEKKEPKTRKPRFEATKIWGYIGLGSLGTLLILIFIALITEVRDVKSATVPLSQQN